MKIKKINQIKSNYCNINDCTKDIIKYIKNNNDCNSIKIANVFGYSRFNMGKKLKELVKDIILIKRKQGSYVYYELSKALLSC